MPETHRIAVLGLGRMGLPLATNLVSSGFCVVGHDTRPSARSRFGAIADVTDTPVAAVQRADVVITMLPDGRVVREVLTGVQDAISPGTIVIDMSSSAPLVTRELGDILAHKKIALIDAPVSGGVSRAEAGTLAIMAGGPSDKIEQVRPILEAMGSQIFLTGGLGSGHAVKALNNYVSAAGLQAACEATLIAQEFGIDGQVFIDVLNASTGRNNSTEVKMKPFVLSRDFGSGFALGLMSKDIRTANDLAKALAATQPGLSATADLWTRAAGAMPNGDHTEIYRFLSQGSEDQG
ncbi:NAD(P)-dependent oxidoreductase [Rhodosalinus sp. K401]|uniref:NAD(P)-dependent oxidoreductase n=1 Tax=Rhodosalinus sp. K401 TaxID=3239195 RepID=UPI0035266CAD